MIMLPTYLTLNFASSHAPVLDSWTAIGLENISLTIMDAGPRVAPRRRVAFF